MTPRHDVIVVGAGPVGLTTALLLASRGVRSTVLEAAESISTEGSKAVVTQRRSLEILDEAAAGLGRRVRERGITWTTKETYWGRRLLFSQTYRPTTYGYPPFVNLPQTVVDRLLLDAARTHYPDLITLRFGFAVSGLRQNDDRVVVRGRHGEELDAAYLVGCDGARSAVRKLCDIAMPMNVSRNYFLITDVADVAGQFPFGGHKRRFYYSPPSDPGGQLLVMPQPDGVWRLDWQIPERVDVDAERASGRLDERVRSALGGDAAPFQVKWASVYRFHNSVAQQFHRGRVVLAGDSAHLLSPFGGRGMNSGIADASCLAGYLVAALRLDAPSRLAEYARERRAAALVNVAATGRALRVMEPPTPLHRATRALALAVSPWIERARSYVDSGPYTADQQITVSPSPPRPIRADG